MNGLCTLQQLQPDTETDVKTVRLTLRDEQSPERTETIKVKPVGRAFALVSSRPTRASQPLNSELIKSKDGDEEIIKVYLKAKAENKANHEWNISQLKDEVRHIQEARTSLKNLRKDLDGSKHVLGGQQTNKVILSEKQNGVRHVKEPWLDWKAGDEDLPLDNGKDLRETAQKLYTRLQEAEKLHQADRKIYEDRLSQCQKEAEQSCQARRVAEETAADRQKEVEELKRLMSSMEKEHQELLRGMKEKEKELDVLRGQKQDGPLQDNFRIPGAAMQGKDTLIQELREKVSLLQAENLELQDKLEHFLSTQPGHTSSSSLPRTYSRPIPQNFKRVYIPAGSGRPFPLIKLVET
ncbi:tuftelin [Gastrophryne carolinensis]